MEEELKAFRAMSDELPGKYTRLYVAVMWACGRQ